MEKDIIVTCPYNKAHRIRKYKLMTHLVKCKKQHDITNKISCPLNSSHIMDQSDMRNHLKSCSNLSSLIQSSVEEKIDTVPVMDMEAHKLMEDWDVAPEVPSYDAMTNAASKKVVRCVSGLTKSEKMKFKMEERARIANLNGINTVEQIPSVYKEVVYEKPLRPPRGIAQALLNNNKVNQQTSDKNAQKQDSAASAPTSTVAKEYRDIFEKTLYDELLSDYEPNNDRRDSTFVTNESQYATLPDDAKEDSKLTQKLLELSVASNDTLYQSFNCPGPSMKNQSLNTSRKEKNTSFIDQHQEIRSEKKQKDIVTEVDAYCDVFGIGSNSMVKAERTKNTCDTNTSDERLTDKLLALLMDSTNKIEILDETRKSDEKGESKNLESKLDNMFSKLTDQLDYLANVQSAAVEHNARLAKEVNDLKQIKKCCNTQSPSILNNPRCGATFIEPIKSTHTMDHNISQEAPTFVKNTPSSHNANRDNDMFNLKNNNELYKLKTPKDFFHNN